jgi:hypothetical protein
MTRDGEIVDIRGAFGRGLYSTKGSRCSMNSKCSTLVRLDLSGRYQVASALNCQHVVVEDLDKRSPAKAQIQTVVQVNTEGTVKLADVLREINF